MEPQAWAQFFAGQYTPSENAILWRDSQYRAPQTLVVMAHGYQAGAVDYLTTYRFVANQIARRGFPVLTGDFGGPATFGNDACSQTAIPNAVAWAQTQPGVKTGAVIVFGGSMGCLSVCNYALNHVANVKAVILELPAVDLQDLHDNRYIATPGDLVAPIEAAYTNNAGYLAALPTHNPNLTANRATLSALPFQIHYSTNDPVAVPSVATGFGTAVNADMRSLGAVGHSAANADFDVIGNFLAAHA